MSSGGTCPFTGATVTSTTDSATTEDAFSLLYSTFTSGDPNLPDEHLDGISSYLEQGDYLKDMNSASNGPKKSSDLLVIGGQHILIYHKTEGDHQFSDDYHVIEFRSPGGTSADSTGFIGMTSISHVQPTLGYFGAALERGYSEESSGNPGSSLVVLQSQIDSFKEKLEATNSYAPAWIEKMDTNGVYGCVKNKQKILQLINFVVTQTSSFLTKNKEDNGGVYNFTAGDVGTFFQLTNQNNSDLRGACAMIATFSLVVMEVVCRLNETATGYPEIFSEIDWSSIPVIVSGQTGSAASGTSVTTNSTLKMINHIAELHNGVIPWGNVCIEPFLTLQELTSGTVPGWSDKDSMTTAGANMSCAEYVYSFKSHWHNLKNRVSISQNMFNGISIEGQSIIELVGTIYTKNEIPSVESKVPLEPSIDGIISHSDLLGLMARIAFTMEDYRETLSDGVTTFLLDLWRITAYKTAIECTIPGLDIDWSEPLPAQI